MRGDEGSRREKPTIIRGQLIPEAPGYSRNKFRGIPRLERHRQSVAGVPREGFVLKGGKMNTGCCLLQRVVTTPELKGKQRAGEGLVGGANVVQQGRKCPGRER